MPTSLVVGASRGLGFELAKRLHSLGHAVYATIRSSKVPDFLTGVNVIPNIDVGVESAGESILDLVFMNAGLFKMDSFDKPDWNAHLEMYKVVSMAPLFIAHHLCRILRPPRPPPPNTSSSPPKEAPLPPRTREEGGGAYGHHASKAAANMVGKQKNVTVAMIHPGFMKTDVTRSVGFDQFYESGGAIEPTEAAESTIDFVLNKLTHEDTGTFWAPRGPSGIGEAERAIGKDLPTPLQLPW
ncbi:oxidoreductase [Schizophyllum commune]